LLNSAIGDALADDDRPVVLDLTRVTHAGHAPLRSVASTYARSGGWPSGILVMVAPAGRLRDALRALGIAREVPLHPNLDEAVEAAGLRLRPTIVSRTVALAHHPKAAGVARRAVTSLCSAMGLDDIGDEARLVASELVTNAVCHGAPPVTLRLLLSSSALVIGVEDGSPDVPQTREAAPEAIHGRGMRVLEKLSTGWTSRLVPGAGKAVSVRLRLPAPAFA
jgi:anti-sigma regulatory factor (Ser/Thr protein kinase)